MIVRITARQRELEEENLPFFTERGEVLRVAFVPVHIPVLQVPREGAQGPVLADALGIDEGRDHAKSRPGAILEQTQAKRVEQPRPRTVAHRVDDLLDLDRALLRSGALRWGCSVDSVRAGRGEVVLDVEVADPQSWRPRPRPCALQSAVCAQDWWR